MAIGIIGFFWIINTSARRFGIVGPLNDFRTAASSPNRSVTASLSHGTVSVAGAQGKWSFPFTNYWLRFQILVPNDGAFVVMWNDDARQHNLNLEATFKTGAVKRFNLHGGTGMFTGLMRSDLDDSGVRHLCQLDGHDVIMACPWTREWTRMNVDNGTFSVPAKEQIDRALDALSLDAKHFFALSLEEKAALAPEYPRREACDYALLLSALAPEEFKVPLLNLLNSGEEAKRFESWPWGLAINVCRPNLFAAEKMLQTMGKPSARLTVDDFASRPGAPPRIALFFQIPSEVAFDKLIVDFESPGLLLTGKPFHLRSTFQTIGSPDAFFGTGTQPPKPADSQRTRISDYVGKHARINYCELPNGDYTVRVLLARSGTDPIQIWSAMPLKISMTSKSQSRPVKISGFSRVDSAHVGDALSQWLKSTN